MAKSTGQLLGLLLRLQRVFGRAALLAVQRHLALAERLRLGVQRALSNTTPNEHTGAHTTHTTRTMSKLRSGQCNTRDMQCGHSMCANVFAC